MKTIIDVMQNLKPSVTTRVMAGIEFNTLVDFRPKMLRAAAHAALTTAIWGYLSEIRRASSARAEAERPISGQELTNIVSQREPEFPRCSPALAAGLYNAICQDLAEIKGMSPYDLPQSAADMYDFMTPKAAEVEAPVTDTSNRELLLAKLELAQKRRDMLDNRTEVLTMISAGLYTPEVDDRIPLDIQLKMADKAITAVLRDAQRYVQNTASKGQRAFAQAMENEALAKAALAEFIKGVQHLIAENRRELDSLFNSGANVPDLDLDDAIAVSDKEAAEQIMLRIKALG